MKLQTQKTGMRYWYGGDIQSIQEECLKVLDGFFGQFGPHVLAGCQVTASGDKYNVSAGLVVLEGMDAENRAAKMVVPFQGVVNVMLPIYLTLACDTETRIYKDGNVKPISYDYKAVASTVRPSGSYATIMAAATVRFVDVIQDATHRFITAAERDKWNGKEDAGVAQTKADAALAAAKEYTARLVADLIDKSPDTLDTFKELAQALGNDPNFATTIFTSLGKKVEKEEGKGLSTNDYTDEDQQRLARSVEQVDGKELSSNDYTDDEKRIVSGITATVAHKYGYDYIVDSDDALAALNNNPNATNVLIKRGVWNCPSSIVLHLNTQRVVGEVGSVLKVRSFGYESARSFGNVCKYSIQGVTIEYSYRGFEFMFNMDNCIAISANVDSPGMDQGFNCCYNLTHCSTKTEGTSFSECHGLIQCYGQVAANCSELFNCEMAQNIVDCQGVFMCSASDYVNSRFSRAGRVGQNDCSLTLEGGFNGKNPLFPIE